MEGPRSKGDVLYRRQDRLRKEEDGLIRVIRMSNLPWHSECGAERYGMETCLFHEVSTADNHSGYGPLLLAELAIFVPLRQIGLLQIPRNNKFEFPSTLLPKVINTRDPTSRSIGRGRDGVCMRNTLR